MRRCRETEYNEYISLCYHSPCYRGFFFSVSTILDIQDISASAYRLQVCSPSQPVLCGILHLTELKDGTFQAIGVFLMPTRLNYS